MTFGRSATALSPSSAASRTAASASGWLKRRYGRRPRAGSMLWRFGRLPYRRFSQPLAAGVEVVLGDRLKRGILGTPLELRSIVRETAVDGDGGDVHEP